MKVYWDVIRYDKVYWILIKCWCDNNLLDGEKYRFYTSSLPNLDSLLKFTIIQNTYGCHI